MADVFDGNDVTDDWAIVLEEEKVSRSQDDFLLYHPGHLQQRRGDCFALLGEFGDADWEYGSCT